MGGQQSVGKNDMAMKPLFYDCRKVPKTAFHMADKMLEYMGDAVNDDTVASVIKSWPRKLTVFSREFRPSKTRDIFQVISCDPKCKLHMNDRHVVLGVGQFSFLRFMALATDFMVEHDPDLLDENGTPLQLEIRCYCLEDELKQYFPDTANYMLHGDVYGIAMGATSKINKPLFDVIKGQYERKYQKTNYVTGIVTSHEIEKLVDDPRLTEIARNQDVTMIYQTLPSYIKASIYVDSRMKFIAMLDEILGQGVDRMNAMKEGYHIEWADKNDVDEIEQDREEIDRQIAIDVEAQRLKKQGEIDLLIAADIFTYELPE